MPPQDQAMQPCAPLKRGPFSDALTELCIVRDNACTNHDIALREERYDDAKRYKEKINSFAKSIHLLSAANDTAQ